MIGTKVAICLTFQDLDFISINVIEKHRLPDFLGSCLSGNSIWTIVIFDIVFDTRFCFGTSRWRWSVRRMTAFEDAAEAGPVGTVSAGAWNQSFQIWRKKRDKTGEKEWNWLIITSITHFRQNPFKRITANMKFVVSPMNIKGGGEGAEFSRHWTSDSNKLYWCCFLPIGCILKHCWFWKRIALNWNYTYLRFSQIERYVLPW